MDDKHVNIWEAQDYSENLVSNLKVKTIDLLDTDIFKNKLEIEQSSKDISTIYSEVKKEIEVEKIDKSSEEKVLSVKQKLSNKDHSQFRTALNKVKNFGSDSTPLGLRSRQSRSTTSSRIQKLSENEKKTISNFFNQFKDLDQEKAKISKNLSLVLGEGQSSKFTQEACLTCIPGHLKTIGWTEEELNIFHKQTRHRRSPINKWQYYSDNPPFDKEQAKFTWGNWNNSNHPYRYLFDNEQEWLDSIAQISNAWKAYHGTMNSRGRRACAVTGLIIPLGNLCSANKQDLEKKLEESKASLELKIGTKLMSLMKRLNS